MYSLAHRFLAICLLRAGPQDLPASQFLLALTAGLYLFTGVALILVDYSLLDSLGQVLLDVGLLGVVTYILLSLRRHPRRFVQTYSALMGTGTLLNLGAAPLLLGIHAAETYGAGMGLFGLLWFVLIIWSMLVTGHIFQHALEVPLFAGILVAMCYMVAILTLTGHLFPVEG